MIIETKYSMFDKVWHIGFTPIKKWVQCEFCDGSGNIFGKNNKGRSCPECHGYGGHDKLGQKKWQVKGKFTIGQIRAEITGEDPIGTPEHEMFSNFGPQKFAYRETYMCKETGIRSGNIYEVDRLWPSKEEAQIECDKRNKDQ